MWNCFLIYIFITAVLMRAVESETDAIYCTLFDGVPEFCCGESGSKFDS